jgi:hypothetical protein
MTNSVDNQLALEDLLADLNFARKHDQIGRLALLAYCDAKGWARWAGKHDVAAKALEMFSQSPYHTKHEFLEDINNLIATLEVHEEQYVRANACFFLNPTPFQN